MHPTIVVEKVYEGFPGEGYEAGAEYGSYTEKGWYGKTPEEALTRFILSKHESISNLSGALHRHSEIVQAAINHLGELMGWEVLTQAGPRTVYEVAKEFGADRIGRIEGELAKARQRIAELQDDPWYKGEVDPAEIRHLAKAWRDSDFKDKEALWSLNNYIAGPEFAKLLRDKGQS